MADLNGQESSTETELDAVGGEPLAGSGFEGESADTDFREGTEE